MDYITEEEQLEYQSGWYTDEKWKRTYYYEISLDEDTNTYLWRTFYDSHRTNNRIITKEVYGLNIIQVNQRISRVKRPYFCNVYRSKLLPF